MNEALIKALIKYKLKAANTIIDNLPKEMSEEIRNLGRIILESVSENSREMPVQAVKKTNASGKLETVTIE